MKRHWLTVFVLASLFLPGPVIAGTTRNVPSGPYPTIQSAIDACVDGDTVLVADGTYTGAGNTNLNFGGRAITVRSENGAGVTIIDCEGSGRGFNFHSGETTTSVVDGFTVRNGLAPAGSNGGGIKCYYSSPTITNCTISGNSSGYIGGGIYCHGSRPTISNCTISGNSADYGGGIFCGLNSSGTISNCTISGNSAAFGGGGIYCDGSSPTISNCTISGNTALQDGGGISCVWSSSPTITNCTISGNSADHGGGIRCYRYSSPTISNCTISGNTAQPNGGGIYCWYSSSPTITNCILWGNAAPTGHEIALTLYQGSWPSTLTVRYSDVQGGAGEADVQSGCTLDLDGTNIDQDPLFVSGPLGDYYLSQIAAGQGADSPCVDAGSDTAANLGLDTRTTRTDGIPDSGAVDMGYHAPTAAGLPGDVDGNGIVDGLDLTAVMTAWETVPGDPLWNPAADLDDNGLIDGLDLTEVISNWTTASAAAPDPTATEAVGSGAATAKPGRRGSRPGNVKSGKGNVRGK